MVRAPFSVGTFCTTVYLSGDIFVDHGQHAFARTT